MRVVESATIKNGSVADDYIYNYAKLAKRFSVAPKDYLDYARNLTNHRTHRQKLADSLVTFNKQLVAGEKTLANANSLTKADSLVVVAGQQPGFFSGPALTVYKAMTAINVANTLSQQLKKSVVPIFWIASEDHDYAEVSRVNIVTNKGRKKVIAAGKKPEGRPSVGSTALFKERGLWQQMAASLPDTQFNQTLLADISELAKECTDLSQWFGKLMLRLLGQYGLVMLDPMLPQLRELATPIFMRAIEDSKAVQQEVAIGGSELAQLDYCPEIVKQSGYMHLFYHHQGNRIPLYLHNNRVTTRAELCDWSMSVKELESVCKQTPEKFSPSAALRPVLQDFLLPTAAFVAGPGEINYLAQLKEVYQGYGVPMPPIYPRAQVTVVADEQNAVIEKLGITGKWRSEGFEEAVSKYLVVKDNVGIAKMFSNKRREMNLIHNQIVERLADIDQKFLDLGQGSWQRMNKQLDYLEKKAWQSVRREHRHFLAQVAKTNDVLLPGGTPQEQVYSFYALLFYYGEELYSILEQVDFSNGWCHQEVYL